MQTYISILRGINVSGHKLIKMKALQEMYEGLGFTNVRTYIQSGNVVFDYQLSETAQLEKMISAGILKHFDFDVPVIVMAKDELKSISEKNSFISGRGEDIAKLHVTFLSLEPPDDLKESMNNNDCLPDEFYISGKAAYLFCPNGYGNTKLSNNFFEKKLKVQATTRNWKTILELLKICETRIISLLLLLALFSCSQVPEKQSETKGTAWLEEITIAQLQQGYEEGRFTITDVVKAYLTRIDSIDRSGPQLNSVITINPDALAIAAELDKERASGKTRGPLHGIPVMLKDNIDTHDKMATTGGSRALMHSFPAADSYVARKLREAGALIIGKTNLSEWANFRSKFSSSGWSGTGGQTRNPYKPECNPCGSSSGSGVAVSANLCAIAIGTETNGSIVCPSNNNGIVGIKPTVGLISRSGIIPISFTQDTPGPMTRTVTDAVVCLGAMTGIDPSDTKTLQSAGHVPNDYTRFLVRDGLKGKRIGLVRSAMGFHHRVDTLMLQAVEWMKSQGAEVVELKDSFDDKLEKASLEVMLFEFKDGLNGYFATLGKDAPVKSLRELIAFNKADSVELRYFDQQVLEQAEAMGTLASPEYEKALATMLKGTREDGVDRLMDLHHLDALMAPTGSPAWTTDLVNGDHYIGGNSSWAAIPGYPSISVPMGMIEGLPVGISFFGRAWSEPVLIEIAFAYEQGTKCRRKPL
jgi:amidase